MFTLEQLQEGMIELHKRELEYLQQERERKDRERELSLSESVEDVNDRLFSVGYYAKSCLKVFCD